MFEVKTLFLKFKGVSHGDDNIFLFPLREQRFKTSLPTKDEDQVRRAMVQMWVDFVRTGYGIYACII